MSPKLTGCVRGWIVTMALAVSGLPTAQAQTTIVGISGGHQGNGDVIRIELSEPSDVQVRSYPLAAPPRMVVDLHGISGADVARDTTLNNSIATAVHITPTDERTRLVLDLKQAAELNTKLSGTTLLLTLVAPASNENAPLATPETTASSGDLKPAPQRVPTPSRAPTIAKKAPVSGKSAARPGRAATPAPQPKPKAEAAKLTLDFSNADIGSVARTMATLTGRNVVVDPRVSGTMSMTSTTPVTPTQALSLFGAQLRTQGFSLIESDGMVLVVPEAEAKLQTRSVSAGAIQGGTEVQTQIFRLTHENANDLVTVLRPLISPNNTINVNSASNSLVITDYGDNLKRLGQIITALDVAQATDVQIIHLHYAVASDLAPLVMGLLDTSGSAAIPTANGSGGNAPSATGNAPTIVWPEPRSNALIVRAPNPARLALAKSLIAQLDQPASQLGDVQGSNIHVVYLKNADATKLAVTLRAAMASLPGQSKSGGGVSSSSAGARSSESNSPMPSSSGGGFESGPTIDAASGNQPSTGGQIQADPSTNSLIISAPEPVYRELRAVIDKLDQRRAQVFVESLIAEVSNSKMAQFGVQWQALLGNRHGSNVGIIGTNFGSAGANIINLAGQFLTGTPSNNGIIPPPQGFNLGAGHRHNGKFTLGALANLLQSSGAGNILSTPTLLTLDNEEARITVGQNVPFVTGSYTNTGSSGTSVSPFQTYEREDVGLTLRVRPQISQDGTIKMVIYQEASSVDPTSIGSPQGIITNKRAIESSVLVEDGAIVVLGGLMQDEYSRGEEKVPGLGDIPLAGNLFKSRTGNSSKTTLMVFLRPVIVRDGASSEAFSLDRYDLLRGVQRNTREPSSLVIDIDDPSLLPPIGPQDEETRQQPLAPPPLVGDPAAQVQQRPQRQPARERTNWFPVSGESSGQGG